MKKTIIAASMGLMLSTTAQAEHVVGTGALALGVGVANVYGQAGISDRSALTLEYASMSDVEFFGSTLSADSFGATYKSYFSNYADGGFWKIGAASFNITASSDTASYSTGRMMLPILTGGFEKKIGENKNFVVGVEGGLGTTAGFGLFNLSVGYAFK